MAKIELCGLFSELHGRLNPQDNFYYATRNGKVYTCSMPRKRLTKDGKPIPKTKQQQTSQERFTKAQKMTTEVMNSYYLRRLYEQQMARQKKYHTLRGYIFSVLIKQL